MNWFDIIKIAPHEKKLGQTSEAWKEEVKDIQREYVKEFPELEWINEDNIQIGYLKEGTLWAKVIELNPQTLEKEILIKKEHIPRIKYALEQFNNADFNGWPDDLSDSYCKMSLQPYSTNDITIDTTWTKKRVNYFLDFWNKIKKFDEVTPNLDVIRIRIKRNKVDMYSYQYYFPIFLSQQAFEYTGQSLDQIQKDFKTQSKAHSKSYDLVQTITNQRNVRNVPEEEMHDILYEGPLHDRDNNNWVEVVGESGRVYYINTIKPRDRTRNVCTVDMFDNSDHWYCTNTGTSNLPYGDFIAGLILITLNDRSMQFRNTVILQE
jgi:hypothetical protein